MKDLIKRYLRFVVALAGILLLGWFGATAFSLWLAKPAAPAIAADLPEAAVAAARQAFDLEITRWNNGVAKKGFFALIGLFLALLTLLPRKLIWLPKLAFSTGLVALIINHLLADGKIAAIAQGGLDIAPGWIALAFAAQLAAMSCTIWRWKVLLEGQGFCLPLKHLVASFLIGRFVGSFAPGTSGLDGYRAYDIARYTGKVARSISVIVVEKLIGFFVLGTLLLVAVPVGRDLFAARQVNTTVLAMLGLIFSGMMAASILVLFKPGLIRAVVGRFVPARSPLSGPFDKALRAVSAYEKRKLYLAKATAIGFGVHLATIGIYFSTSRAVGAHPPAADLFATGALMIGAVVLPLSIAGIGMREGVFAFFLGPAAAIYAFSGYLVGEIISLLGGPVWLARRSDYYEVLKTQRDQVNAAVDDEEPAAPPTDTAPLPPCVLPSVRAYALDGLGAGLVAGLGVALFDAGRLWLVGGVDWSLPGYAGLLYGPLLGILGGLLGVALALLGRLAEKEAAPPRRLVTAVQGVLFFSFAFVIGYFYLFRDVFGEKAPLFSPRMLGSLAVLGAGLLVFTAGVGFAVRRLLADRRERLVRFRAQGLLFAVAAAGLVAAWLLLGSTRSHPALGPAPAAKRPNVILVMNDTHRADFAGPYGCKENLTPNLDAFARDGVVYEHAFAQASWTRPSVATILTGRFPSSHTATLKGSMLPDEVTTLAEVMTAGGYESIGLATNFNLTPFFRFDQGFHTYLYLAPNAPLGASDEQSKLVFIEVLKKVTARLRGNAEVPEDYYVVGEKVTAETLASLDARSDAARPFFLFTSYMDVHDPYFRHPYDGYAVSHRAHPEPDLSMAAEMRELYKGEVRYWDGAFGALIAGLKQRGLYDESLIVVTSDHGEEFGEHGGFWHGTTLYDEQLKIIFIAKPPRSAGIPGGTRIADWVRLVDVAPFIADQVGLPIPGDWQGTPAPAAARVPVFAEEDHEGNLLTSIRYVDGGAELKLIRANPGNPRGLRPTELYRTDADPGERQDLAAAQAAAVEKAGSLLEDAAARALAGRAAAKSGELSGEAHDQLKALGYIKDDR